ncbi:MAG: chorismate lyase [Methylophilaceae bacterium]
MQIFQNSRCINRWLKKPISANSYQHWLIDNGSLTLRLMQRHPSFSVKPLSMRVVKPLQDEKSLLHLKSGQAALIREVLLMSNNQPVVFAHSVLSKESLHGDWQGFGQLGSQSLGAALFANPRVKRTPLRFRKLSKRHMLYQLAVKHIVDTPNFLWARRSVFSLHCANILVTEIFLPKILEK